MALNSGLVHEQCRCWCHWLSRPGIAFSFPCHRGGLAFLRDPLHPGFHIPLVGDTDQEAGPASPHAQIDSIILMAPLGSRCCMTHALWVGRPAHREVKQLARSCTVSKRQRWDVTPAWPALTLLRTTELVSSSTAQIPAAVLALQSPGSGLGFPTCIMSEWDLLMVKSLPAPRVSASLLICNFLSHLALVMGLREGETRWVGSHSPQPSPRRGRGREHGLLKARPGGLPCWILEPEQPALGLGTEALQLPGAGRVRSLGWHGWPGGPGRAGWGCVPRGPASITASSSRGSCQVVVEPGPSANVLGNWIAI